MYDSPHDDVMGVAVAMVTGESYPKEINHGAADIFPKTAYTAMDGR